MRGALAAGIVALPFLLLGLALALGGPRAPPPMASIGDPFRRVDFSALPPLARFVARDGQALAYRAYGAASPGARGSAVLIHGSSARSQSMHPLASALARAGFTAYALDVRGHGESGAKGRIAYVGQLEDDLEDFLKAIAAPRPRALVGFSSGGGFALRFAASPRQELFDGYVLLSPFLHPDAPTYRSGSGGWVSVGVPRAIALAVLNRFGLASFNDLPVVAFALGAAEQKFLTPRYSYALAVNFRPDDDYRADIRRARRPMRVLVGQEDEVFRAERFAEVFDQAGRPAAVTIVPGVGHVGLTVEPAGIRAIVSSLGDSRGSAP